MESFTQSHGLLLRSPLSFALIGQDMACFVAVTPSKAPQYAMLRTPRAAQRRTTAACRCPAAAACPAHGRCLTMPLQLTLLWPPLSLTTAGVGCQAQESGRVLHGLSAAPPGLCLPVRHCAADAARLQEEGCKGGGQQVHPAGKDGCVWAGPKRRGWAADEGRQPLPRPCPASAAGWITSLVPERCPATASYQQGPMHEHCTAFGSLCRLNAAQKTSSEGRQWMWLARVDTYRQDLIGEAGNKMNLSSSTSRMSLRILPVKLAVFLGLASRRREHGRHRCCCCGQGACSLLAEIAMLLSSCAC